MNRSEIMLLEALKASVRNRQITEWNDEVSEAVWHEVFYLSRQQHVLPLVLSSICQNHSYMQLPAALRQQLKREITHQIIGQVVRTEELKKVAHEAQSRGLYFLTMKGVSCRALYPNPDARPSSDEDLLVPQDQFADWVDMLLAIGYKPQDEHYDVSQDFEIGFTSQSSYLELHRSPFSHESGVFGLFNTYFENAFDRKMPVESDGADIFTMGAYDHMLYLLLHAFKHLIHSGFGLRQVCDIILWAEKYGEEIDWYQLNEACDRIRCWGFAATVFEIGQRYFEMDTEKTRIPQELLWADAPCEALLQDLINGGVYGGNTLERKHSSTITLKTVESSCSGKKGASLLYAIFPPYSQMVRKYPYLKHWSILLPIAWFQRIFKYAVEIGRKDSHNRPSGSIRIGNERKELLKKLDILD